MVNTKNSNKVAHVGNLLTNKPHLTPKQIAKEVGCHITLVYQVRKAIFMKDKVTVGKSKMKAKKAKVAKVAKQSKEVVEAVIDADLLTGACKVIDALVKATKDLCFAFDHQKQAVEILWHEELYDVSIAEVPQTIEAIRFLQSKEKNYRNLPANYDDSIPF